MTIYLVVSGPDFQGRHHFWSFWPGWVGRRLDEWGVRGQIFHANLEEHCKLTRCDGSKKNVKVVHLKEFNGASEDEAMRRCEEMVKNCG